MPEFGNVSLIITFFGLHDSEVKGRTRIQKEICILKHEDEIPISFDFKPYFYGPYSVRLSNAINVLVATGIVEQTITRVGFRVYRYDYNLTPVGRKLFLSIKKKIEERNPEILSKLDSKIKKLEEMSIPSIISQAKECSGIPSIET